MSAWLVKRRLWYATNAAAIRKIKAGERPPFSERGMRAAEPGDVVTDIPRDSAPGLLRLGYIEPAQKGGDLDGETHRG